MDQNVEGNPSNIVIGGPGVTPIQVPDQQQQSSAPAKEEAPKTALYKGALGEANTPEELVEYTKKLESSLLEAQIKGREFISQYQAPQAQPPAVEEEPLDELLYKDPKKAVEVITDRITSKIEAKANARDNESKFWTEFYAENPDLKGATRLVNAVKTEKWNELKPLALSEAKKFLAKEARSFLSEVRKQSGTSETELRSGAAVAFGSSSSSAPAAAVETSTPISFNEQVKRMKRKGK